MRRRLSSPIHVKIAVVGPYNAGKSSVVRGLARDALSVNEFGTTVSIDYGFVRMEMFRVHLFGTPGHDRFDFMQEIAAKGSDGIMLVVDSTFPETFPIAMEILRRVRERDIPFVVLANKQDQKGALSPEDVKREMGLPDDVPVIGTVATKGMGLKEALVELLKLISKKKGLSAR